MISYHMLWAGFHTSVWGNRGPTEPPPSPEEKDSKEYCDTERDAYTFKKWWGISIPNPTCKYVNRVIFSYV